MNWQRPADLTMPQLLALLIALGWLVSQNALAQTVSSIQPNETQIDPLIQQHATTWNLTIDEWNRQTELRTLHHGLLSKNLTPLEILGILAETPEERRRYAELFAQRQLTTLQKITEFEADYLEALATLSGEQRQRLQLVSSVDCITGVCTRPIAEALNAALHGTTVDLFLLAAKNDQAIRVWATHHRIPPQLVRDRTITLNHARPGMQPGLTR